MRETASLGKSLLQTTFQTPLTFCADGFWLQKLHVGLFPPQTNVTERICAITRAAAHQEHQGEKESAGGGKKLIPHLWTSPPAQFNHLPLAQFNQHIYPSSTPSQFNQSRPPSALI